MKTYKQKISVQCGEWTSEKLKEEQCAGADDLLLCTVVRGEKSKSFLWHSSTPTGEFMSSDEIFDAWMTLTKKLGHSGDLNNGKREVVQRAFEAASQVRKTTIMSKREVE